MYAYYHDGSLYSSVNISLRKKLAVDPKFRSIANQIEIPWSEQDVIRQIQINLTRDPYVTDLGFYFDCDLKGMRLFPGHHHVYNEETGTYFRALSPGDKNIIYFANHVDCVFTVYSACYVNGNGAICNGTHEILNKNYTALDWMYKYTPGTVYAVVKRAIVFGHGIQNYGHFCYDTLAPLMLVPKSFYDDAHIVTFGRLEYKVQFYNLLGIPQDKILYAGTNVWIYCDEALLSTHPRPHLVHFGPALAMVHQRLRKNANCSDVIPTRYVFMNRRSRTIKNYNESYDAIAAKFPHIKFEKIVSADVYILEQVKLYSTFKFIITISGSNCFHLGLMKEGTVAVIVGSVVYDYSCYMSAQCNLVRTVIRSFPTFSHDLGGTLDIPSFVETVEVGLYYDEHKKWPNCLDYKGYVF